MSAIRNADQNKQHDNDKNDKNYDILIVANFT